VDKVDNTETMIDFIRHGEPAGGRMYRGNQVDHPLSEQGWQQMHEAISKQYLGSCPDEKRKWDLIVTSPMQRCHAFAKVLSQQLSIPVVTNTVLTEISFGEWEGKTPTEIKALDPILFRDFQRDPVKNRPPGAESLETFSKRIMAGLSLVIKEYQGEKILLVTHAGIMRTILIHVLSAPLKSRQSIRFPYAGMLRLFVTHHASHEQMQLEYL
jgi:broad specificity phosphatase PhoE